GLKAIIFILNGGIKTESDFVASKLPGRMVRPRVENEVSVLSRSRGEVAAEAGKDPLSRVVVEQGVRGDFNTVAATGALEGGDESGVARPERPPASDSAHGRLPMQEFIGRIALGAFWQR